MIRALNYPQPQHLSDAIVLDLTKRFTGSPGNALVRLNPKIAQTFSLSDLIDLQEWYYNGDESQEDFVKFELLPQLITAVLGDLDMPADSSPTEFNHQIGRRQNLNDYLIDTAGSIGGGSDQFYDEFGTLYEAWKQGRLYVSVIEIDSEGDYRTGKLYIPFWLTDQLLSINTFEVLKDKLSWILELERNAVEDQLAEFLENHSLPPFLILP
jgi:hypothetical protein|tara:strand:- start:494 stop:1126 length:633 start_codon:yes stop_codon:yes gene_type:complete